MSISTTYNVISKNGTYSLNWPTQEVINPSLECPIIGVLTSYTEINLFDEEGNICLLYTSPSPRDQVVSRMPSSA